MLLVKADLAVCSTVIGGIWIVLECGFHVKLDNWISVLAPGIGKSSHICTYICTYKHEKYQEHIKSEILNDILPVTKTMKVCNAEPLSYANITYLATIYY